MLMYPAGLFSGAIFGGNSNLIPMRQETIAANFIPIFTYSYISLLERMLLTVAVGFGVSGLFAIPTFKKGTLYDGITGNQQCFLDTFFALTNVDQSSTGHQVSPFRSK